MATLALTADGGGGIGFQTNSVVLRLNPMDFSANGGGGMGFTSAGLGLPAHVALFGKSAYGLASVASLAIKGGLRAASACGFKSTAALRLHLALVAAAAFGFRTATARLKLNPLALRKAAAFGFSSSGTVLRILPAKNVAAGEFYIFEATGESADGTLNGEFPRWHKSVQADQTDGGWDAPTSYTLQ